MFRIIQFISWCLIHQILKNVSHVWDCNCITHTFYFSRSKFCRVDTNNLTFHIQKSTATVTRVDSRICLDQVYTVTAVITSICYCVIVRIHSAVLGTYDTGCNRLSISKSITDCNYLLTYLQIIRTANLRNWNGIHCIIFNIIQRYRYNCKISLFIKSLYGCLHCISICKCNWQCIRTFYYMIICSNQKFIIILTNNNTGTTALYFLFLLLWRISIHSIHSEVILYLLNWLGCNRYNRWKCFWYDFRHIKASFCCAACIFAGIWFGITGICILLLGFCICQGCLVLIWSSFYRCGSAPSCKFIYSLKASCCQSSCKYCT